MVKNGMLFWLLLLAACDDTPDVKRRELVGRWTVNVEAQSGCWPAFSVWFTVTEADAAGSGPVMNVVSEWGIGESSAGLATGNFDLEEGTVAIRLWKQPTTVGGEFLGEIASSRRLEGAFWDIGGGFIIGFGPQDACNANATAVRE